MVTHVSHLYQLQHTCNSGWDCFLRVACLQLSLNIRGWCRTKLRARTLPVMSTANHNHQLEISSNGKVKFLRVLILTDKLKTEYSVLVPPTHTSTRLNIHRYMHTRQTWVAVKAFWFIKNNISIWWSSSCGREFNFWLWQWPVICKISNSHSQVIYLEI